jgi:hypothetical protein
VVSVYRKKYRGWHNSTPDEQERHLAKLELEMLALTPRRADVANLYAEMRRQRKARRERDERNSIA